MLRILRRFGLVTCSAITTVLTAGLVYWIEDKTRFSLYRFTFWFIMPAGAFICGVAGASGAFFGSRVLNARPGKHLAALVAADSLLMFFSVNWLEYSLAQVHGLRLHDEVSFATYLAYMLSHASINTMGLFSASIGWGGYFFALLDFVGFFFGARSLLAGLSKLPYCEKCDLFFRKKGEQNRYFQWEEDLTAAMKAVILKIKQEGLQVGVAAHAALGSAARTELTDYVSRLDICQCNGCAIRRFGLAGKQKEGKLWKPIKGLELTLLYKTSAQSTVAPDSMGS